MLRLPRKIAKDNDELIIDEVETAILNAEKKCSKGKCTLPETQHLQIRVNILKNSVHKNIFSYDDVLFI